MVFEKVVELIVGQLPVEAADVKMESRLFEDLGADSANVMRTADGARPPLRFPREGSCPER